MSDIGSHRWAEQLAAAELQARIDHDNGRCHLSEWSCSYCEAEGRRPARPDDPPCSCGRPAVVVYLTDKFGPVPSCR